MPLVPRVLKTFSRYSTRFCSFLHVLTAESPRREGGKNALRVEIHCSDDLAKMAQICAVVPGFARALLFAKTLALCTPLSINVETPSLRVDVHVTVIGYV